MAKTKKSARLRTPNFSKLYLLIFLAVFALGGYVIYRTLAATTPGVLEAEAMTRPPGVKVFGDEGASGDKAVIISKNNKKGLTGTLKAPYEAFSFSVVARATGCRGVFPSVIVNVSGGGVSKTLKTKVNTLGWKTYEKSNLSLPVADYKVKVGYSTYSKTKRCQTRLYVDAVKLGIQPPQVSSTSAADVEDKKATLKATFNTHGQPATYYFEYGPTTAYGTTTKVENAKAVNGFQEVKHKIDNLSKGTTYHFRLCVVNAATTKCGSDAVFTTRSTPALHSLNVSVSGNRSDEWITGNGIDCGGSSASKHNDCFETYEDGKVVELNAKITHTDVKSWSSNCSVGGKKNRTCTVTMDRDQNVSVSLIPD